MNTDKDLEIIQLIKTNLRTIGEGVEGDPIRRLIQFWDMQGKLVFEYDTWTKEMNSYLP